MGEKREEKRRKEKRRGNPLSVILWLDQGIHTKGRKMVMHESLRMKKEEKMGPPVKPEDDGGWQLGAGIVGW